MEQCYFLIYQGVSWVIQYYPMDAKFTKNGENLVALKEYPSAVYDWSDLARSGCQKWGLESSEGRFWGWAPGIRPIKQVDKHWDCPRAPPRDEILGNWSPEPS